MKKAIYHSILVSLLGVSLNFAFKIYVAKIMDKSELALYFTAIDIFTMTLLVLVGFRSSMVVSFAQTKDDKKILNTFRIVLLITLLLVWGLVIPYLKHIIGININYWLLVFTAIALALNVYFSNMIAMYRMYDVINKVTFLDPILIIIWFLIVYFIFDILGIKALFLSTILTAFSISIFIFLSKRKEVQTISFNAPKWDKHTSKFLKNSLISTIEFGSGMAMMYIAVLLMIKYFNLKELGDFQVVSKPILSYMITLFVFPIFRFILPELSKLYNKKHYIEILKIKYWVLKYSIIISITFMMASLLFANDLVRWLFPPSYHEAALMIIHLSFFFIFIMLNAYQISFIKASGDFLSALLIRLWGIVSLLIIFYIIYYFYSKDILSVIVALVGSYVSMFLVSFYQERKILRKLKEIS